MRGFFTSISIIMKITKDKVRKEDISDWALAIYELIESKVDLTEPELEQLCFDIVETSIEKFFDNPVYRNYN